jgi:hypothetical protein
VVVLPPVVVVVPVVPVGVPVVPVVVVLVEEPPSTTISPTICGCAWQTKAYVPGLSNRQEPAQPWPDGKVGSGGTAPITDPAVCVQMVGSVLRKSTLWKELPLG